MDFVTRNFDPAHRQALVQAVTNQKKIGRLEEALRSMLSLVEQGAFAIQPTPEHVQRILDQAKKELETE